MLGVALRQIWKKIRKIRLDFIVFWCSGAGCYFYYLGGTSDEIIFWVKFLAGNIKIWASAVFFDFHAQKCTKGTELLHFRSLYSGFFNKWRVAYKIANRLYACVVLLVSMLLWDEVRLLYRIYGLDIWINNWMRRDSNEIMHRYVSQCRGQGIYRRDCIMLNSHVWALPYHSRRGMFYIINGVVARCSICLKTVMWYLDYDMINPKNLFFQLPNSKFGAWKWASQRNPSFWDAHFQVANFEI